MPDISDLSLGLAAIAMIGWVAVSMVKLIVQRGHNGSVAQKLCDDRTDSAKAERRDLKRKVDSDRAHIVELEKLAITVGRDLREIKQQNNKDVLAALEALKADIAKATKC